MIVSISHQYQPFRMYLKDPTWQLFTMLRLVVCFNLVQHIYENVFLYKLSFCFKANFAYTNIRLHAYFFFFIQVLKMFKVIVDKMQN